MQENSFPHNTIWGNLNTLIQSQNTNMSIDLRPRPIEVPPPPMFWKNREPLLDTFLAHFRGRSRGVFIVYADRFHGLTALGSEFTDRVKDDLPGGHYYINTRGLSDYEAMDLFFHRHNQTMPDGDWSARSSAFRTIVGDRRALVVLDGVTDSTTVERFRPGTDAFYLVLSNDPLLDWTDARRAELEPLSRDHAIEMLAELGLGLNSKQMEDIVDLLPRLPGVLCDAAVIAAQGVSPEDLVSMASDEQKFFTEAFKKLPPIARRCYRVLSTIDSTELEEPMLRGLERALGAETPGKALQKLKELKLIAETSPAVYRLRIAPREVDPKDASLKAIPEDIAPGIRFTTRWLIRRAQLADRRAMGLRTRAVTELIDLGGVEADCPDFTYQAEARQWFTMNRRALVKLVKSKPHRTNREAVTLCDALWAFFSSASYFDDALECYEIGVEAADGDRWAKTRMTQLLGKSQANLRQWDLALETIRLSLEMAEAEGDPVLIGTSLEFTGRTLQKSGSIREAIDWLDRAAANGELERTGQGGELGAERAIGLRRWMLGDAYRAREQYEWAIDEYRRALAHLDRVEDIRTEILVMIELSFLEMAAGDQEAAGRLESAIGFAETERLTRYEADACFRYGRILEPPQRYSWLRRAYRLYDRDGNPAADEVKGMLEESGQPIDGD